MKRAILTVDSQHSLAPKWSTIVVLAFLISLTACSTVRLSLHHSTVEQPSNIALYFSVETSAGDPVANLTAGAFRIYEDGQVISRFESKQTILNPEVSVVHNVLLLLDLSGSIRRSGSIGTLIDAATSFGERVSERTRVAVYGFDGGKNLIPITNFTKNSRAIASSIARLPKRHIADPSTNLNGAITSGVALLEGEMRHATQPLRFGTLVVFTDGTDRAHRVTTAAVNASLDRASVNVFTIGLGAEISEDTLRSFGRAGFIRAKVHDDIPSAFNTIATRIESEGRKFYLLSYCSPSRAGTHEVRVEVSVDGKNGSLSREFNAHGFRPHCDPKRIPKFKAGRVLLRGNTPAPR